MPNLVTNPDFETDTNGWTSTGPGVTLTRSSTQANTGAWSLKAVCVGAGGGPLYSYASVTPRQSYQATWWLFGAGGEQVFLQWDESDTLGGYLRTINDTATLTLVAGWQPVKMTAITGTEAALLSIYWTKQSAGTETIYTDTVSVQAASSFIGGTWTASEAG